ncbi:MAG: hypothetical protein D6717_14150 [Gammaproteobacteria bacterium]|nr:MAG: hypothetical protein D6717_14150 [Gammaproteobacteria bacterium]
MYLILFFSIMLTTSSKHIFSGSLAVAYLALSIAAIIGGVIFQFVSSFGFLTRLLLGFSLFSISFLNISIIFHTIFFSNVTKYLLAF